MNLTAILAVVTGVLVAIVGLYRSSLSKTKDKLKQAQGEAQSAKDAVKVVTTHLEQEKAVAKQESAKEKELEVAADEEIIDIANSLIDDFNN
jgi:uncharacterized phage infection (PIP) family protein YhgE